MPNRALPCLCLLTAVSASMFMRSFGNRGSTPLPCLRVRLEVGEAGRFHVYLHCVAPALPQSPAMQISSISIGHYLKTGLSRVIPPGNGVAGAQALHGQNTTIFGGSGPRLRAKPLPCLQQPLSWKVSARLCGISNSCRLYLHRIPQDYTPSSV